jgi:hypothetical protein
MSCCARPALPPVRPCCDVGGAAADPEWTVGAARDTALGVVGISNLAGASLGSGFWITTSCVCTAWDVVSGQAGGVRVIVPVSYGAPMLVDALFIFGAQEYGLALLEVQPALFPPGYMPSILPLAVAPVLVGQSVYALGNAGATTFGAFVAGTVRDVTFSVYGDVSYLTLGLALGFGAGGAPVLRRCDDSVIGVALYYRYAPGDMVVAVSGATLGAFLTLAGSASIDLGVAASGTGRQTLPVLTTPARLTGATTFPTPVDTPTLGTVVDYLSDAQPALPYTTTLPCMTASISPQTLVVGETASGMWAYDPTLVSTGDLDAYYGTLVDGDAARGVFQLDDSVPTPQPTPRLELNISPDASAYACAQNFVRLPGVPVIDITTIVLPIGSPSYIAVLNDGMFYSSYNLENNINLFDPATDNIIYASDFLGNWVRARSVTVYAAGLVVMDEDFDSQGEGLVGIPLAQPFFIGSDGLAAFIQQSYPVLPTSTQSIIAPFASTDFIYRGDNSTLYGTPGYALEVSAYRDNTVTPNRLTVQWKGFSQVTHDPVLFQVMFTVTHFATGPPVYEQDSGQVLCLYGSMPGTWAGGPWLTASTLPLNFSHLGYINYDAPDNGARAPFVQILRAYQQPVQNEAIYFGRAAGQASLAMAVPMAPAPLTTRFLVPWRTPGGDLPMYDASDARDQPYAQGTTVLVWLQAGALNFQYAITGWLYDATPLRVTAVGSKPIGAVNTNVGSLLDAIVGLRAVGATQRSPAILNSVSLSQNVNGSLTALSSTAIASLLASARLLGAPGASVDLSTLSDLSFVFNPAPNNSAFAYSSAVMTVPSQACGGILPNIVSTSITVLFDAAAVLGQTATPLIIVQLAAADSTSLITTMATDEFAAPSAIVIYNAGGGTFQYCLRNGAGGIAVNGPNTISIVDGIASVTVTLAAPVAALSAQRPNTLITGRPPRANNGPYADSGEIVNTGTLVPATVIVNSMSVATRARVSAHDTTRTWAITSAPPQPIPYEYPGTFDTLYQSSINSFFLLPQGTIRFNEASPTLIPLGVAPVAFNTFAQAPLFQLWNVYNND